MTTSRIGLVATGTAVYWFLCHSNPDVFVVVSSFKLSAVLYLLAASAVFLSWDFVLYPRYFSVLRHLPGPKGGSFWHGQLARLLKEAPGVPHREWMATVPNQGLIRYLSLFNSEKILLTQPDAIQDVLVTRVYDFEKPKSVRENMVRTIGNGLLLAEGKDHKYQRKHLQMAYKHRLIKDMYPIFWEHALQLADNISQELTAGAAPTNEQGFTRIAFREKIHCTAMDTIGHAGMGAEFGALENHGCEVNQLYGQIVAYGPMRNILAMISGIVPSSFLYALPLPVNRAIDRIGSQFRNLIRDAVQQTRVRKQGKSDDGTRNILEAVIEGGAFTDSGLEDQAMTMIAAGIDPTSVAISWALLTLAKRPEISRRLQTEIRTNIPSPGRSSGNAIMSELIDSLPYLSAFCNEVNRFFPGVPVTSRVAIRDTIVAGQAIPKGTNLVISAAAMNTDKRFWGPDAQEFNPERFLKSGLGNSGGVVSVLANLTFLHGPHSCIGERFARSELLCLMAVLAGRFAIEMGPQDRMPKARPGINPLPEGELELLVKLDPGW